MEVLKPKWFNSIMNIIGVNSLLLGGLKRDIYTLKYWWASDPESEIFLRRMNESQLKSKFEPSKWNGKRCWSKMLKKFYEKDWAINGW